LNNLKKELFNEFRAKYENGPKLLSTLNTLGKVDKTADGKAYEIM
jgi:hypothetical protein